MYYLYWIVKFIFFYYRKGALNLKGAGAGGVIPDNYEADFKSLKQKCCVDADLCDLFHQLYEPVSCRRYFAPEIAYLTGAGHFSGFDETERYEFHGKGEFTYLSFDPET